MGSLDGLIILLLQDQLKERVLSIMFLFAILFLHTTDGGRDFLNHVSTLWSEELISLCFFLFWK